VTGGTNAGDAKVFASNISAPAVSNINWVAGQSVTNAALAAVGPDGKVKITNGSAGTTQFILDVQGWWSTPSGSFGGMFFATTPSRLANTVDGTGTPQVKVPANSALTLTAPANPFVLKGAIAVNLTVVNPAAAGSVLGIAGDTSVTPPPNASNVNFAAGQTIAGFAIVKLADDLTYKIYNASPGPIDVIVDEFGFYSPQEVVTGTVFQPVNPTRAFDTRPPGVNCGSTCDKIPANTNKTTLFAQLRGGFGEVRVRV